MINVNDKCKCKCKCKCKFISINHLLIVDTLFLQKG